MAYNRRTALHGRQARQRWRGGELSTLSRERVVLCLLALCWNVSNRLFGISYPLTAARPARHSY